MQSETLIRSVSINYDNLHVYPIIPRATAKKTMENDMLRNMT
jgi:hypothetical protein